jgi:hypothetical protein
MDLNKTHKEEIQFLVKHADVNLPEVLRMFAKEYHKKQLSLYDVVPSNRYKTDNYLIYTPEDDESVIVIEDTFKTQKTVDVNDFDNLMDVLHSVQDY